MSTVIRRVSVVATRPLGEAGAVVGLPCVKRPGRMLRLQAWQSLKSALLCESSPLAGAVVRICGCSSRARGGPG